MSHKSHPIVTQGCAYILAVTEVSQVLFRLSRWENLEYAKEI